MRKRRDLEYAKICLEEWAKYMEDDNGFPARSPTAKYGELKAHRAESSLPTNIEPNSREVDHAMLVLAIMSDSNPRSMERAEVLKQVYRNRCNDETIEQAMGRLGIHKTAVYYSNALGEFSVRLDTVIYSNNSEIRIMGEDKSEFIEN